MFFNKKEILVIDDKLYLYISASIINYISEEYNIIPEFKTNSILFVYNSSYLEINIRRLETFPSKRIYRIKLYSEANDIKYKTFYSSPAFEKDQLLVLDNRKKLNKKYLDRKILKKWEVIKNLIG